MTIVEQAIKLALDAHSGQKDKSGQPYILHSLRVMESVRRHGFPDTVQVAAVLHGVLEDTSLTLSDLHRYGVPYDSLSIIQMVTHDDVIEYEDYIAAIIASDNDENIVVKFFDVFDNLNRLTDLEKMGLSTDELKAKYFHSLPLLRKALPRDIFEP